MTERQDDAAAAQVGAPGVGRLAGTVERVDAVLDAAGGSVDARALVDRATGVLMERLGCGPQEALRELHARARAQGRAVLRCADEILSDPSAPSPRADADGPVPAPSTPAGRAPGVPNGSSGTQAAALPRWHAEDGQRAVTAILEHALQPFGADSVQLWAAREDGGLRLAGRAGLRLAPGTERALPGFPGVAAQAVRAGEPVWAEPSPATPGTAAAAAPVAAVTVAVPALRRGRVVGALEISWTSGAPARDDRLERELVALAELAAHTLDEPAPPGGAATSATGEFATAGVFGAPGAMSLSAAPPTPAPGVPVAAEEVLRQLADSLHDPALVLTPLPDADGNPLDFRVAHVNECFVDPAGRSAELVRGRALRDVYPGFWQPGGPAERIAHVHASGEAFRCDRLALVAEVGDTPVTVWARVGASRVHDAVLLTWRVDEDDARLGPMLQHAQRLGRIGGFEDDLVSSRSTWNPELFELFGLAPHSDPLTLSHLRAWVHRDDREAFDAFLAGVTLHQEPREVSVRFHRDSDHVVRHVRVVAEPVVDEAGSLVAIRGACQDVSAHHWTEVALSATRDQLAHTQAEADERARLARRLQHAIMPPTPGTVSMAGLTIGVRYRPAHQDHAVGGDWYDAVPLPNGDVLISVGDVAGHGIEAATGMVALRNALRGLATTGAGPGQLLAWLNDVAFHLTESVTATAVCGLYQPEQRLFRWARAGHPPPVLLHEGVSRSVDFGHGILLGAIPDAAYAEQELTLPPDATLLLFTDGLIERKDSSGLDDLHAALRSASFPATGSLADQLDHLLAHSRSDTDDDTCLIGIHRPAEAASPGA
ncbi:SpoIIE family protein phosphatase [Streptacidiphilus jiangxiensis]|uniref:Serine phosphatase RsbU, regulator of sigma subunit n=1 Tax=Streptacidiphilus jiangxiensis TaxID=235985 RepID=A0A1H7N4J6_STRJI|nr:SpoIIE family protein phosphatase [Streptacidiphilus jiangxiensis]SEL18413.1 Serine phosphatase RsbU, regulator of sigma subunit [Streptacidiphilus jiangxiensis]